MRDWDQLPGTLSLVPVQWDQLPGALSLGTILLKGEGGILDI